MAKKREIHIGDTFGRWVVIGACEMTDGSRPERSWPCRCSCGTERAVLERSLIYGSSLSCGCLKLERASEKKRLDLRGKTFGSLTAIEQIPARDSRLGLWWRCRCSCGMEVELPATLLATGRKTHCGCKANPHYAFKDISGQKFDRLTALYPVESRYRGSVVWHCRCDCGKEVDVSYNHLLYTDLRSCGCMKRENNQKLQQHLSFVDGTSLDSLKSTALRCDNTTGVKGVYRVRGKYMAKIVFQKKQYHLGFYRTLYEAAFVRSEAEKQLQQDILPAYARWKKRAETDPAWGEANPVRLIAEKDGPSGIRVTFLPDMTE